MSKYITCPDDLLKVFLNVSDSKLRSTLPYLRVMCEHLVTMPGIPIELSSLYKLIESSSGFQSTANQRVHIKRLLNSVVDSEGPITFILPNKKHIVFFSDKNLTKKQKAVATARMSGYLHLDGKLSLPANFNESMSQIDRELLNQLKSI
jgi:hypothetical protein